MYTNVFLKTKLTTSQDQNHSKDGTLLIENPISFCLLYTYHSSQIPKYEKMVYIFVLTWAYVMPW